MVARSKGLIALCVGMVLAALAVSALVFRAGSTTAPAPAQASAASRSRHAPKRIVSLVPSLTEALYAIGAGPQVVGVGSYDSFPPEIAKLPRVGALLDPNTERILSLRPDMVAVYGTQADLLTQLARAGVPTFSYRHQGIANVFQMLHDLGVATGHEGQADRVAGDLQRQLDATATRVRSRPRPRTLLVFDRQPRTLRQIYASGGIGFVEDLLAVAGGTNVFADVQRESVQPSQETLIARAPEVIIEIRGEGALQPGDVEAARTTWNALPSLPAVRNGRVYLLVGNYLMLPGPRLAQAADALARTLHPDAFQ